MVNAPMFAIVKMYQSLSKRKVWIDSEFRLDQNMSVFSQKFMSPQEAITFVRDALLKEGVEIREVGDSEAYVGRAAP